MKALRLVLITSVCVMLAFAARSQVKIGENKLSTSPHHWLEIDKTDSLFIVTDDLSMGLTNNPHRGGTSPNPIADAIMLKLYGYGFGSFLPSGSAPYIQDSELLGGVTSNVFAGITNDGYLLEVPMRLVLDIQGSSVADLSFHNGQDTFGTVDLAALDSIFATDAQTFYTSDGTLDENRTVDGGGFTLDFTNLDSVEIESTTFIALDGNQVAIRQGGQEIILVNANEEVKFRSGTTDSILVLDDDGSLHASQYGDTMITGTFTTILGSDIDGNIIEIRADEILGTETDSTIYNFDGTLTENRTLTGGSNDLTFTGVDTFTVAGNGMNVDATNVDMDGTGLTANYTTITTTATGTHTTTGADVAVNSTGGDVTVSSVGGDVVVNAGANTLNITADSSYVSEDLQLSSYGDTAIIGTVRTILATDASGNVIETTMQEILASEPDSTIYTHDGTLTENRTLTGGGLDLTFTGLDTFNIAGNGLDVDATNVDMDGTNLTENYADITSTATATHTTSGNDVISTATATNSTSGGAVTVSSTGGDVTVSSVGGDVVVNAGTEELRITADSTYISEDVQFSAYGDTMITGTFTTILGSDIDGNIIEIRADEILGTETDSTIYNFDGTLTENRTLTGGNNDLTFTGVDTFTVAGNGMNVDATNVDMDGTGLTANYTTITTTATGTHTTTGADVAVNSTGGDVTVSSVGGDVVVNAGANTLNITADSSYVSEDLQLSSYGDTAIIGTVRTILATDASGNVIETTMQEILASEPDSTIYTHDGTLTENRTLTGGGLDLTFTGLDTFNIAGNGLDVDATNVDMDGTNLTENYADITSTATATHTTSGNDVISTATATNSTSGGAVTVSSTGGDVTVSSVGGDVVVNAGTEELRITADSTYISEDVQFSAYGDTMITGTFTTILGSDIDGNIIEIRADEILGTETDSTIYNFDGTLTENRTLTGGSNDLTFTGVDTFTVAGNGMNVDATNVDMDGTGLTANYTTITTTATGTHTTTGADVAVNSTGGDVTVSSVGGDVVVSAGANTLNITADSSYVSEDLQLSSYGDTAIIGTVRTILATDASGNVIETTMQEILASEPDSTIYTHDGTLTENRTLTGGGLDLTFTGLDTFNIAGNGLDVDATNVDMDGTNLTENYADITSTATATHTTSGNDVISTATATNSTSGGAVTVSSTGGAVTLSSVGGDVVVNAGTEELRITADSTFISEDVQFSAYGDTMITGTFTTILGSDIDGNIIEIRADEILGTETDSTIYNFDGTLTENRTLTGGNNDLTFTGVDTFTVAGNGMNVDATNVDMDGTGLTANYTTITTTATGTHTTTGADVAVNSTGGDVTVSSVGGDVVVNAGANTLNITADSSYVSEDLQLSSYGDTAIIGTVRTILATDASGNVIETTMQEILASEPDSTIYTHDGTLTENRTLTGGGLDLTFTGLDTFNIAGNGLDVDATNVDMDGTNLTENYADITSTATATHTTSGNDVISTATATNSTSGGAVTVSSTGGDVTVSSVGGDVVVNAGTEELRITADSTYISEDVQFSAYGDTMITGTFTTILGSDIDGNVIEVTADQILGTETDSVIYRHDGTLIGERTMTMAGFNLNFVDGTDTTVIANDGRVAIGTGTFTPNSVQSNVKLEVNGDILAVRVHSSSDARFKKNINPIESALQKVMSIEGVTYDFRTDEFAGRNFPTTSQIGFVAQNVESVLPEVVRTNGDGYKAVDYAKITALLNEAIKEQQMLIEQLNEELRASKTQNQYLAGEIASIKQMLKKNSNLAISDED